MIEKLLDVFLKEYKILPNCNIEQRRQVSFELLSCIIAFKVSPYFAKDNCWMSKYILETDSYSNDNEDGGVDGYHIIANENEIIVKLNQSKYSNSLQNNEIEKYFRSVNKYIVNTSLELSNGYTSLEKIRTKIKLAEEKYPVSSISYELHICTLDISVDRKKEIETIFDAEFLKKNEFKLIINDKNSIENDIEYITKDIIDEKFNNTRVKLRSKIKSEAIEYRNSKVLVTVIDGNQVFELINKEFETNIELSRLFAGNVRGFLEESEVNLQMKKTIEDSSITFLSKNNGIVVVCDKLELNPNHIDLILENPIIVNGQQTVSSIYLYAKNPSQKNKVQVQIKFIELNNYSSDVKQEIILDIAKASNDSNQVTDLDLLSNRKLFKYLKKSFSDIGKYLKIKEGEILNNVLLSKDNYVDFNELLKVWVSIYLKRPADAKATKKNIHIFNKAYEKDSETNSYSNFVKEENYEKIKGMFINSSNILDFMTSKVSEFYVNEIYFEHAKYFIIYLLSVIHNRSVIESTEEDLIKTKVIIEKLISDEKEERVINGKEFTFNNYFKSQKPQQDYLKSIGSLDEVESVEKMLTISINDN